MRASKFVARPYLLMLALLLPFVLAFLLMTACQRPDSPAVPSDNTTTSDTAPENTIGNHPSTDTRPADPADTTSYIDTTGARPDTPEPPKETTPSAPPVVDPPDSIGRPPIATPAGGEGAGLLIAAVHGTGKKGAEAVVDHGFVLLRNSTVEAASLKGLALYYKTEGEDPYVTFVFPDDATVPAGGTYLVRANAPADTAEANIIMRISHRDADWDVHIDNKEVRLLLAPAGLALDPAEDITARSDALSVFYASVTPHKSVYAVDDLTRNKIAVRTADKTYSGYHLVNLTRATTEGLEALCPTTSAGMTNEVVTSRLSEVIFSHAAGIYPTAFDLTLYAPEGYTIYYTTDGSDPSQARNTARKKYTGEIRMKDTSAVRWGPLTEQWWYWPGTDRQIGGTVIKACAIKGSTKTPVYTNTYFVTGDLAAYGVTVMSISLPADQFLGNGFYERYQTSGDITATRPRGTGILEVFDPAGNRVGNSRVEMAVSGNGSSGAGMKSIRVYYKSKNNQDAGLQSDLHYDLFNGLARDAEGEVITSFSRLLLRNSGNDCGHSYIRDAYMQRACADLKADTMASASTLVFVNGEFWGVYNARERYSPEYIASHYGINKDNVAILESDYAALVYGKDPGAPYIIATGIAGDERDFNDLADYIRTHDMADPAHYAYACERLDLDSLMDLWIARLYFNARDWPENNMKVWRNRNPEDPSGFDTKWHFALLDMDMGFSYFPTYDENDTGETANYFHDFFNPDTVFGDMTLHLLENSEFRDRFLGRFYTILCEVLTAERLSPILEDFIAERTPLMPLQEGRWLENGASVRVFEGDCADMRSFVANRNEYALRYLMERFGVTEEELKTLAQPYN